MILIQINIYIFISVLYGPQIATIEYVPCEQNAVDHFNMNQTVILKQCPIWTPNCMYFSEITISTYSD